VRYFDVFNGDADGICALHQLRLADPVDSTLVTGLKRDIELLAGLPAGDGDVVTVLDVSLDRNRDALAALLDRGAVVQYFDHHYAGEVPRHPALNAVIDQTGRTCTSALIDRHLRGAHRAWAVVGAFGDGFDETAAQLAARIDLDAYRIDQLRELGVNLNYSAYGQSADDVLVLAEDLYHIVSHYRDPFDLLLSEPLIGRLDDVRRADLAETRSLRPSRAAPGFDAWFLPDEPWARRVIGTFASRLALADPHRAHAVLVPARRGGYVVSLRASSAANHLSAVEFCRRFPTGGGRASAAGIDRLDEARVDAFLSDLDVAYPGPAHAAA
jgi:hypothetical protein